MKVPGVSAGELAARKGLAGTDPTYGKRQTFMRVYGRDFAENAGSRPSMLYIIGEVWPG